MSKLKEKEVDGKMVLVDDQNAILERIRKVCDKVERAQDSYKSIMEDVYLVHKYKMHKAAGKTFADYMQDTTGMGRHTAHRLVKIWKTRLIACKKLAEEFDQEDIDNFTAWMEKQNMRNLLTLAQTGFIDSFVDQVINEGMADLDAVLEDCKRDYIQIEEKETPAIEDKTQEHEQFVEGNPEPEYNAEDVKWRKVDIVQESDLDALMETLSKLFEDGYQLEVNYRTV